MGAVVTLRPALTEDCPECRGLGFIAIQVGGHTRGGSLWTEYDEERCWNCDNGTVDLRCDECDGAAAIVVVDGTPVCAACEAKYLEDREP